MLNTTDTLPQVYFGTIPEGPSLDKLEVLRDALDLVADLWPKPGSATIHLETHQWQKLRRVLLAIPDLVADDER